jgi:integrase
VRGLRAVAAVAGSVEATGERLRRAVDLVALAVLGWDGDTGVFTPAPGDRLLGYRVCLVVGCGSEAGGRQGLCGGCATRRADDPDRPMELFIAEGMGTRRRAGQRLCRVCRVPGFARPSSGNGLCMSCDRVRAARGQDVSGYVDGDGGFAPAMPRAGLGICAVASCGRLVARRVRGLCEAHDQAWRRAGSPSLAEFARTGVPAYGDRCGRVVLAGLPERVVLEVLLGVQACLAEGRRVSPSDLRAVVDHLRRLGVGAVGEVDMLRLPPAVRHFLNLSADRARLACTDLAQERVKDVWDLRLSGWRGRMSFVGGAGLHRNGRALAPPISQPWLKEAAKAWAGDTLTATAPTTVRTVLAAVGLFSEHLTRRSDHGSAPGALDRIDVEGFLARLGHLQAVGRLSDGSRGQAVDALARFLREARALGLTRPGGPLAGLPDRVTLRRRDRPPGRRRDQDDVGRALPEAVLAQLLDPANLDRLQAAGGPGWRAAVELMAGVGRRPGELCRLGLQCLDYDQITGAQHTGPVLVHDMTKVAKTGCRLPINDREAAIITAQQARVRADFPHTPPERLALFPRPAKNPDGTKPVTAGGLALTVRAWVDALPRLDTDERGTDGRPVPFPRARVFPYAFRHTYAQRHADAGTPVDTLKELLGHDTVRSTLGYYKITTRRRRDAIDRLGPLQIDAGGQAVRPGLTTLADTQALREQVGQVAVPFGICTEPTNVAAGGGSCPFRHRCTGCEYFRTDPSYTSELRAYLTQLLADRERLTAAVPALAEWARRDAAPSSEEVDAVRRLVRANDEALTGLDEQDRHVVEEAIATIRAHRAHLAATFPPHLRGLTRQNAPVLFPTIERAVRTETDHG